MEFFFEQLANWKFYLIGGFPATPLTGLTLNIVLALLSIVIGLSFAVILGLGRISVRRYIRYPCGACVDIVRSTPLLLIVFWFYFFLPVLGVKISILGCAIISLSVYAAAYQAEIVRAGILAVPAGQMEAGLSTGMSKSQVFINIIFPQAFRMMLPSFVSFFNSMFKNTSTVYIIGVVDLTRTGIIISQLKPNRIYAAYALMALGFWIVCYALSFSAQKLEKKLGTLDYESYKPEICRDDLILLPLPKAVKRFLITQK
ncbi:MAG: amino acid ABC transporter permease [Thermodesulfovibrionia bacterium]|nr:amino acid ABC transporter permease [Thermodesulfovibrionia bacterium]